MVIAIITGAIGGGLMGAGNVYGDAFANNGVLTIFTYAAFGMTPFIFYLAGCAIAFFGAAILTYIVGFEDDVTVDESLAVDVGPARIVAEIHTPAITEAEADYLFTSPVKGHSIPLSEVGDEVFASGALGQGLAVIPTAGEVVAPCDCTVAVLYPTGHAMGFILDGGVELLVHVGMNTVELDGKYFTKHGSLVSGVDRPLGLYHEKASRRTAAAEFLCVWHVEIQSERV